MATWRVAVRLVRGLALTIMLGLSAAVLLGVAAMHHYGDRVLGVQTGSMEPAVRVGDGLVVRKTVFSKLAVGDIVSYQSAFGGSTISHRIISIDARQQQLVTKGDSNAQADGGAIKASQIVGRAEAILPYAGSIGNVLRNRIALIFLVFLPAIVLIVYEILHLKAGLTRPYRLAGYQK